jgi:uncharacterized membrane protein YphA (DoxX/SURF4 family)
MERLSAGFLPFQSGLREAALARILVGTFLIAAGICVATSWKARISAALVGIFFILGVIFLHTIRFFEIVHSGVGRTRAFEPLAIGAAALVLAGTAGAETTAAATVTPQQHKTILFDRWIFAASMVIFGIQHFMYLAFIATPDPRLDSRTRFWGLPDRNRLHRRRSSNHHRRLLPPRVNLTRNHVPPLGPAASRDLSRRRLAQRQRVEQPLGRPILKRQRSPDCQSFPRPSVA